MPRARMLSLVGIRAHRGRCPWRIDFRVDEISLSAFFRPPAPIAHTVGPSEVALLALPILCDLVAEVRPRMVQINPNCQVPAFRRVFAEAAGALLAEQDAYCGRSRWTPLSVLTGRFARRHSSTKRLNANRVVLGFSGGKDSIVSLFTLLAAGYEVTPVLLNEGDRSWQDMRRWIPKLRRLGVEPLVAYLSTGRRAELNHRYGEWHLSSYQIGWLTALLALCAERMGARVVSLGIESSADQTFQRYREKLINHQHQKTTQHLATLERFYRRVLNQELQIASPIAGLTDAQVIRLLLERVPGSHREFSSCGGANSRSKHCGQCEKCAFVYALLSASKKGRNLAQRIFRADLLNDVELYRPWLDSRYRPPLACIGSRREIWDVFEALVHSSPAKPVIRQWRTCTLRRTVYGTSSKRSIDCFHARVDRRLAQPVIKAASLVQRWLSKAP